MHETYCRPAIQTVTVYPEQARITRVVELALQKGENRVVMGSLPPQLQQNSVRLDAVPACRIVELIVEDRMLAQPDDQTVFQLRRQELDGLDDQLKLAANTLRMLDEEFQVFLQREPITKLLEREHARLIQAAYWQEFFTFFEQKLGENRSKARAQIFTYLELLQKRNALQDEINNLQSHNTQTEHVVTIVLDAEEAGSYVLSLSALQDGAAWHPAYSLRFLPDAVVAELTFHAMIRQETGELWSNVEMLLSTAVPAVDCSLPKLVSRRLKEAETKAIIRDRPAPLGDAFYEKEERDAPAEEAAVPVRAKKMKQASPSVQAMYAAAPTPAGGAYVAMPARVAMPHVDVATSTSAAVPYLYDFVGIGDALLARQPDLQSLPAVFRDYTTFLQAPPAPVVPEASLAGVNQFFQSGTSPQYSCGGYDYRYRIHQRNNTVPSQAAYTQLPVETRQLPVRLGYVTIPFKKEQVYLQAFFTNSGTPMPAGPAQVFLENDFVSGITLETIASRQEMAVSLGVDKDIKVLRKETVKVRSKGFSKDVVSAFQIVIEAVSFKSGPIDLEVYERIPMVQEARDVTVSDVTYSIAPGRISERGVVCWNLVIQPQQKLEITVSYNIKTKEDCRIVLTESAEPQDGSWMGGSV